MDNIDDIKVSECEECFNHCPTCKDLKEIEKSLRLVLHHLDEFRENKESNKKCMDDAISCAVAVYERIKKMMN